MMTEQQLRNELTRLGIDPPDKFRAIVYLPQLQEVYDFLRTTLPTTLGNDYSKVQPALENPEILNGFCHLLDRFVYSAINLDLAAKAHPNNLTFAEYYRDHLLANHPTSVTDLLNRCQVIPTLITNLTADFKRNLQTACQRIIKDWQDIQKTFLPPNTLPIQPTLERLTRLSFSGSDLHKDGTQVLLLTFEFQKYFSPFPLSELRLVYKPSDLEADCLLVGNSEAVNAVHPNFQADSLVEIINRINTTARATDPRLNLRPLPTYKILPYNPGSSLQPTNNNLPIRESYGYIEFLNHIHAPHFNIFDYYPFGYSDFVIFPRQNERQITRDFYTQAGQLTAIAATFSLKDLHNENLIVKQYQPHLIDLETSLLSAIESISDTELYGAIGALNGSNSTNEQRVIEGNREGQLRLRVENISSGQTQNALYRVSRQEIQLALYRDLRKTVLVAFRDQMNGLQHLLNDQRYTQWQTRLDNVVVRYIPLATQAFEEILNQAINETNCNDPTALDRLCDMQRGDLYERYRQPNVMLDPNFLAFQNPFVVPDFKHANIPIFYHRIGTQDIMDSRGDQVTIPTTLTYRDQQGQSITVNPLSLRSAHNFFATSPTQTRVINSQINRLSDNSHRMNRISTFAQRILQQLSVGNPQEEAENILGLSNSN